MREPDIGAITAYAEEPSDPHDGYREAESNLMMQNFYDRTSEVFGEKTARDLIWLMQCNENGGVMPGEEKRYSSIAAKAKKLINNPRIMATLNIRNSRTGHEAGRYMRQTEGRITDDDLRFLENAELVDASEE